MRINILKCFNNNQFVNEAIASTTFPWNSLNVLSALDLGISNSCTIKSTSSFFIDTLANSFSRANFSAVAAACLVPKKGNYFCIEWYLSEQCYIKYTLDNHKSYNGTGMTVLIAW